MVRLIPLTGLLLWLALLGTPNPACAADPEIRSAADALKKNARDPFEQDKRTAALRKLGRIGGAKAAAAVLPVFDDPFEHLADHAVSAWITMVKGDAGADTVAWLAKKGLTQKNPDVRAGAAAALAFSPLPAAGEALAARTRKEKDPMVLAALIEAWSRTEAHLPSTSLDLLRHKDGRVTLATVEALARRELLDSVPPTWWSEMALAHKDPVGRAAAVLAFAGHEVLDGTRGAALLADPDEIPRLALAEVLGDGWRTSPEWDPVGLALLRSLLGDASWRVRARAIQSAVSRWRAEVVPLLIERLPVEQGRLRLDLADALATLTGKADLGGDVDLWRSWWAAQGDGFYPGDRPKGRRPQAPTREVKEGETTTATFFRLPVLGTKVAFLLDCSGSMRDPAVGDAGKTKWEVAREEVARTLEGLGREVQFDVFLYRYPSDYPPKPRMTSAHDGLKRCTAANAAKARKWLAGSEQDPKGWGAFSDALDHLLATDVDTIFFLTDGRPSRGRFDRDTRLLTEFARSNRFRQVVVHTVLAGRKRADRQFLEDLAHVSGGHFADATKEP